MLKIAECEGQIERKTTDKPFHYFWLALVVLEVKEDIGNEVEPGVFPSLVCMQSVTYALL